MLISPGCRVRLEIHHEGHVVDANARITLCFGTGSGDVSLCSWPLADEDMLFLEPVRMPGETGWALCQVAPPSADPGTSSSLAARSPLAVQNSDNGQFWLRNVTLGSGRLPVHIDVFFQSKVALDEWCAVGGVEVTAPLSGVYPYQVCIEWEADEVWDGGESLPPSTSIDMTGEEASETLSISDA